MRNSLGRSCWAKIKKKVVDGQTWYQPQMKLKGRWSFLFPFTIITIPTIMPNGMPDPKRRVWTLDEAEARKSIDKLAAMFCMEIEYLN